MYKTCLDIEGALYIAPNEIRSCCQRFFYDGKMRGDAKLIDIQENTTPTATEIKNAREKLLNEIQNDQNEHCKGCPKIKKVKEKPLVTSNISHLSIEHHSVCNLRCSYCSEIYWGGKKSKYNVVEFISYLARNKSLDACDQVVWGGGEPTLDKSFEQILVEINKYANPKTYHRVFTNSVRFSNPVLNFLKKGLIKITTSIDSGTPEKFKEVRGRPKFFDVFQNLNKYSEIDPTKITIKYILTDENKNESELRAFVENCIKFKLKKCNYQISINYKKDKFDFNFLKSITYLFSKLYNNDIKKIFVDDHIVARFCTLNKEEFSEISSYVNNNNMENIILDPHKIKDFIIFGCGKIAEEIIKKTTFIKFINNYDLIDSDKNKIGKIIFNKEIQSPNILKNDSRKIFIASAEYYDEIYNSIKNIRGDANSILSGLII